MGGSCCRQTDRSQEPVTREGAQGGQELEAASEKCKEQPENNEINLRGMSVKQALEYTEQRLSQRVNELRFSKSSTERNVIVITGKGIQSKDGVPKIRPAIKRFLEKNGYRYGNVIGNKGRLEVHL